MQQESAETLTFYMYAFTIPKTIFQAKLPLNIQKCIILNKMVKNHSQKLKAIQLLGIDPKKQKEDIEKRAVPSCLLQYYSQQPRFANNINAHQHMNRYENVVCTWSRILFSLKKSMKHSGYLLTFVDLLCQSSLTYVVPYVLV